jgi:hypothetical protein
MATVYWETPTQADPLTDLATWTGTVDGVEWTVHGDDLDYVTPFAAVSTLRYQLANALMNELDDDTDFTVSPYLPRTASPPHITIEPDQPFMEQGTFGKGVLVWAYKLNVVVAAGDDFSGWRQFEIVAPRIITAMYTVQGARFETFDAPELTEVGERMLLVGVGHVTIKQRT